MRLFGIWSSVFLFTSSCFGATLLSETLTDPSGTPSPVPAGWSTVIAAGVSSGNWVRTQGGAQSTASSQGETQLYTPLLTVGSYPVELSFLYTNGVSAGLSGTGLVLEVSRNGGLFEDFRAFGNFLEGSYNASIDSATNNPLLDGALFRSVFRSATSTAVRIELPSGTPGFLQFRWRLGAGSGDALAMLRNVLITDNIAEPTAVPEPATVGLTGLAIAALSVRGARRNRA